MRRTGACFNSEYFGQPTLSGSSFYSDNVLRDYTMSRLDSTGWLARWNRVGEYLQADFVQLQRIQAIVTTGMSGWTNWVTSYKLAYSTNGATYHYVDNDDGSDRIFSGNSDRNTVVEHSFEVSIVTRFVRLYPQTYYQWMAVRWEVYGCSHHG